MKVKHSWLHTVTMHCDQVITITWWGNALEHDDLSALSWPQVFLEIIWLQVIPYFINQDFFPCFILWKQPTPQKKGKKRLFGTAVLIACVLTAKITASITSLLSTCHHFAGKQPAECKGCNFLSSSRKMSSWYIFLNVGSLEFGSISQPDSAKRDFPEVPLTHCQYHCVPLVEKNQSLKRSFICVQQMTTDMKGNIKKENVLVRYPYQAV